MNPETQASPRGAAAQSRRAALQGIRVLDLTRLAPGPYCSMLLGDMGAEIIVVGGGTGSLPISALARGKRLINLDLKSADGLEAFRRLAATADVVIEGYRPGVMERLGIGYKTLSALNSRMVYCSLTGYGQSGPLSQEAGHDLNYLAVSGVLGALGPEDDVPAFPLNLLADFAGGSLFAALAIVLALYERSRSGEGQYIDSSMVDGCMSMMAMHFVDWGHPVLQARGDGLVAGNAPFYRCYRCFDGQFVAVGALERRFFESLWTTLGYAEPPPNHLDRSIWTSLASRFAQSFAEQPRDVWAKRFYGRDACVSPVLNPAEALVHPHNHSRHPQSNDTKNVVAPILSRTPGYAGPVDLSDKTVEVLCEAGFPLDQAKRIAAASRSEKISGLAWPPI
jgi:alpha-methylacyl-CoA racemase